MKKSVNALRDELSVKKQLISADDISIFSDMPQSCTKWPATYKLKDYSLIIYYPSVSNGFYIDIVVLNDAGTQIKKFRYSDLTSNTYGGPYGANVYWNVCVSQYSNWFVLIYKASSSAVYMYVHDCETDTEYKVTTTSTTPSQPYGPQSYWCSVALYGDLFACKPSATNLVIHNLKSKTTRSVTVQSDAYIKAMSDKYVLLVHSSGIFLVNLTDYSAGKPDFSWNTTLNSSYYNRSIAIYDSESSIFYVLCENTSGGIYNQLKTIPENNLANGSSVSMSLDTGNEQYINYYCSSKKILVTSSSSAMFNLINLNNRTVLASPISVNGFTANDDYICVRSNMMTGSSGYNTTGQCPASNIWIRVYSYDLTLLYSLLSHPLEPSYANGTDSSGAIAMSKDGSKIAHVRESQYYVTYDMNKKAILGIMN